MKAVILAAGRGKRLGSLTDVLPKPLLPIAGKPILQGLLEALVAAGFEEAIVVTARQAECVREFCGTGERFGLRLQFLDQGEPRGTGDAVRKCLPLLDGQAGLIVAGDTAFAAEHVAGLVAFHRERKADASLCLKRLPPERIGLTSSVRLEADGRVTRFVEKPAPGEAPSDLAAALLHLYEPAMVGYIARIGESPRGEIELTEATQRMIEDGRRVMGRLFPTPPDLTTAEDFLRLNFPYASPLLDGTGAGDASRPAVRVAARTR
jgi:NDP-sugar pyrophosphorylase family protein